MFKHKILHKRNLCSYGELTCFSTAQAAFSYATGVLFRLVDLIHISK